MPDSHAMQRVLVLLLLGCAVAALHCASAETTSCPVSPGAAAVRQDKALSMLQVKTKTQLNKRVSTCACAAGDDPCECEELGYCTAAADPHFVSFDGYLGDYRRRMFNTGGNYAYRLVKTDTMEIQGLTTGGGAWVSGFAVGGEFLKGHSLKMIMHGRQGINKMGSATVLLDGRTILEENTQEHIPGVLDAQLRTGMSQEEIEETIMRDLPEFQLTKKENFATKSDYLKIENIEGSHWYFKLPERVEIFVDDRFILIKMPKCAHVKGWCGNFNGDPDDDYTNVWGSTEAKAADGLDLLSATDSSSSFKDVMDLVLLATAEDLKDSGKDTKRKEGVEAAVEEEKQVAFSEAARSSSQRMPGPCGSSAEKEAEARRVCGVVLQPEKRDECVFDVCKTGDTNVWKVYLNAEVEEVVNARGIPEFMGHGRCLDSEKRLYTTLAAKDAGMGTPEGCRGALRDLAPVRGVRGAQLAGGACQILVDREHGGIEVYEKVSDGAGELIVESTDGADGYTCWKLN